MDGLSRSMSPPTHFRFQIESFSSLSTFSMERVESCVFEAGDSKWKLAFYPKGNKERNAEDHISLYLVSVDNKEILVSFILFVFDQIKNKYLPVQSLSRFHATKSEAGFDKFLPLNIFKDPSNGYLVEDVCMFGAEVFFIEIATHEQCLSVNKAKHVPFKYTWKIDKFSELEDQHLISDILTVEGHDFEFWLYPKGNYKGKGKYMSLYFGLFDVEESPEVDVFVEYAVRVIDQDQVNQKHLEKREMGIRLCSSRDCQAWSKFVSLANVNNSTAGYLVNDTLILEAEVIVHHSVQSQD